MQITEENRKTVDQEWEKYEQKTSNESLDTKENTVPEANFVLFISGLATQALLQLGEAKHPVTNADETNLTHAKYTIDSLKILEEKTKGNLSDEEAKYFTNLIYDLRGRYLNKIK